MIKTRIEKLRKLMREEGIAAYLIPTDDFHGSEYVGEFFKCRQYISGFTGSAGTVVVTLDKAGLWTDGRYFLQAEAELLGSGIDLYRQGQVGVPSVEEFLSSNLKEGETLGFDGRTVTYVTAQKLKKALKDRNIKFSYDVDLVGDIWEERPSLPQGKAWILGLEYAGKSREEKIKDVRNAIAEKGADVLLLTSLDDIMWLFNVRGNDVFCNPVMLSYAALSKEEAVIYADESKFSEEDKEELMKAGISFKPYDDIYCVSQYKNKKILIDESKVNFALISALEEMDATIIKDMNPTTLMKAVKNPIEMENMRRIHVKDGVAMTKLMYWLKNRNLEETITEIDVADKIEGFRQEQDGYLGPTFYTISAYGTNGAIVHYFPTEKTNKVIENRSFLLVDTGGFYMGGTTDITRTFVMGELTQKEKDCFTAVLKGHLALGSCVFPKGTRGVNLDILARRPIWAMGLDYNHGTGHGVGYMLNVHEGPNSIRSGIAGIGTEGTAFEVGMITSNEPGVYITGEFGIRTENLILCTEAGKAIGKTPNSVREVYGDSDLNMLEFETLTLAPYDLDAVNFDMLDENEKALLNEYHKRVYETIGPLLTEEERAWLLEFIS